MNLFAEAKKVLDKDGKVNPLGPYGKQKLTGREIATYFRRNKVKDPEIRKAVEVALDLGGADTIARSEIKKFYGDKILKSKEVQSALQYANEEVIREGKGSDIFKKYGSIINRLSDKEKDEVIELLYTMNTQTGRRYKEAFGKVKELLNMEYIPENAVMSAPKQNMSKIKPMLTKLASKHKKVEVSFGTHSKGKFVDDNNINFKGSKKDIDNLMKDIQKNKSLMKMMEETISEGKNLVPAVKKIVDTKGAAKVGGVMIDMFTASMISQIYDKVNDQNKKRMENSNIQTLVNLAQKMMQKNSVEEGANPAQQAAIAISKKEKAGKPGYDKEGKSLKKESVMDSYRKMWEDAQNITEVSDKEINAMKKVSKDMQKVLVSYQKIANMGDKELKNTKHNYDYEQVLKARDTIISMIGKLQTKQTIEKSMKKEDLDEKLSKQDLKFMDMMYDKKGNLTDVGKAVMNYKPGDNIRKIVQNLNNKKK